MNKIACALLALSLLLALAGCGGGASTDATLSPSSSPSPDLPASDIQEGDLGQAVQTLFFDFVVVSATTVNSYAGYTPAEEMQLLDVVIQSTNTFGEEIAMLQFDFQVQWGDTDDPTAFAYPLDPLDDTMAPLETMLADGETMEYHYVYPVPAGAQDLLIAYQEAYIDLDGNEGYGDVYFVPL